MKWQITQLHGTANITARLHSSWSLTLMCVIDRKGFLRVTINCMRDSPRGCELSSTVSYPPVLMPEDLAGWIRGSLDSILAESSAVEAWVMEQLL